MSAGAAMNLKQRLGTRWGARVALLLALIGGGLIILSTGAHRSTGSLYQPSPVPTPPWQPMPTRAAEALTPTGDAPVPTPAPQATTDPRPIGLQQALLSADLARAQHEWGMLQNTALAETVGVQLAGARLALLNGDLDAAEQRAMQALQLLDASPGSRAADGWSLLGVILNRQGEYVASEQAFAIARSLDPNLEPHLFDDRWRNAVRTRDAEMMSQLAGTYSMRHPEGPMEPYYRAATLLADNQPWLALGVLHPALAARSDAPALLWYTLGDIYLALNGFSDAATAFEVAATKVAQGDTSLSLLSEAPLNELSLRLARAYLATDRCAEAESLYRRLSASYPDLAGPLEQAVMCQTPTPTPTHWIIRLQPTPTPNVNP